MPLPSSLPAVLPIASAPVAAKPIVPVAGNGPTLSDYMKADPVSDYIRALAVEAQKGAALQSAPAALGAAFTAPIRAGVTVAKDTLAPLAGLPTLANKFAGGALYGTDQPLIAGSTQPQPTAKPTTPTAGKTQASATGTNPVNAMLDTREQLMQIMAQHPNSRDAAMILSAPYPRWSPAEEAIRTNMASRADEAYTAVITNPKATRKQIEDAYDQYQQDHALALGVGSAAISSLPGALANRIPGQ